MAGIKHFAQINGTSALKDDFSYIPSQSQSAVSVPRIHVAPLHEAQQSSSHTFVRSFRDNCINGIMNTDVVQDLRYGTSRGLMPRNATPTWKVVSACTVYGVIAVLAIVIGI